MRLTEALGRALAIPKLQGAPTQYVAAMESAGVRGWLISVVESLAVLLPRFTSPPPETAAVLITTMLVGPGGRPVIGLSGNYDDLLDREADVGDHMAVDHVARRHVEARRGGATPVSGPERGGVRVKRNAEPAMSVGRCIECANKVARSIKAGNHAKVGDQHSAARKQRHFVGPADRIRKRSAVEVRHLRMGADVEALHIRALGGVIHRALVGIEKNVTRAAILNRNVILIETIALGIELEDVPAAIGLADVGVSGLVEHDG